MSEGAGQPPRAARRLFIDLTPLRRSRDFRRLVTGELVSALGTQLTTVAVPYQVYQLTRSSLVVGLVSITQLAPLIAGSLLGGSIVDAMDRRRVLMLAQVLMAACSAGLAVNADLGPRIGDLESGAVATAFGDTVSVVSGGLACIAGALLLARLLPGFRHQRTDTGQPGGRTAAEGA